MFRGCGDGEEQITEIEKAWPVKQERIKKS